MTTTETPTPGLDTLTRVGARLFRNNEDASSWAAGFAAGLSMAQQLPEPAMDLLMTITAENGAPPLHPKMADSIYAAFVAAREAQS